jgi:hypothetical protein
VFFQMNLNLQKIKLIALAALSQVKNQNQKVKKIKSKIYLIYLNKALIKIIYGYLHLRNLTPDSV